MPTALQLQLRPASFRGVPFNVTGGDISAGRRNEVHEYPKRDKPWVEDNGRATREISVSAVLVGADYIQQSKNLLAALETPGTGTLIHPWLGTLTVALREKGRISFDSALGKAVVELQFVEAGELDFPGAQQATQQQSRLKADALQQSAVAAFAKRFNIAGLLKLVEAAARGDLANVLGLASITGPLLEAAALADKAAGALKYGMALLSNPGGLGLAIAGAFGLSGLVGTIKEWGGIARGLVAMVKNIGGKSTSRIASGTSENSLAIASNADALAGLVRQTLLVQAVAATSLMDVTVADDAQATAQAVMQALDDESRGVVDDALYAALQEARAAVWADISARAQNAARLLPYTPADVQPAVCIAYELYEDAARDQEITARNHIRNPLFTGGALQVLSK